MRVAVLAGFKDGAIDQVMRPLVAFAKAKGVDVDLIGTYDITDLDATAEQINNTYDLLHYGFFMYHKGLGPRIFIPQTANLWHIGVENIERYQQLILNADFKRIVVDDGDHMTIQQLGQMGFTKVTPIPIMFDYGRFHHLPIPKGPFTVGIFCNDYNFKRFDIIIKAAERAEVECHAMIMPEGRHTYALDPIRDVYSHIHALAHATFVDTNSLPAREALLCGRPILATRNGGLDRVLKDGVNALWHDGSIADLAAKMKQMRDDYDNLAAGARATILPDLSTSADQYIKVWENVIAAN